MYKISKFILLLLVLLQGLITIASGDIIKSVGYFNKTYKANKAKNNAIQKDSYLPLVAPTVGAIRDSISIYAKRLEQLSQYPQKQRKLADRAYKLLKEVYQDPKKTAKVERLLDKFSKDKALLDKAAKFKKYAKKINHIATGITAGTQLYEWKKSDKDLVSNMKLVKDLLVDATSYVPVAGEVVTALDIATDEAVDRINNMYDNKRKKHESLIDQLFGIKKKYDTKLRRSIIYATNKNNGVLRRDQILKIYKDNKIAFYKEIEPYKKHWEDTSSKFDKIANGRLKLPFITVAHNDNPELDAYHRVQADATRWMHPNEYEKDLKRLEKISKKTEIERLTIKLAKVNEVFRKNLLKAQQEQQVILRANASIIKKEQQKPVINKQKLVLKDKTKQKHVKNKEQKAQQSKVQPVQEKQTVAAQANTQLQDQKTQAEKLRKQNTQLAQEYKTLYIESHQHPDDKSLQQKLARKDKELRANAQAFLDLRAAIRKIDKTYFGTVDGPLTVQRKIPQSELQPKVATVFKTEQQTKQKIKQNIQKKIVQKAIDHKIPKFTGTKQEQALKQAEFLRNRNQGKKFSQWNKRDKVAMGIIARNLGIAKSASSITQRGAILNALFNYKGEKGIKQQLSGTYYAPEIARLNEPKKKSIQKVKTIKKDNNHVKSAKSKAIDNHLKQSVRVIAQQKHQLSRKEMELQNAKDKLSKMKRSTYSTRSYTQVSFDNRKINYLRRANSIINKNRGKSFSKWSKSDQVSMGIIARNLGIARSSSIIHKGAILNALYRSKGFYGMKNQFAKISTTRYKRFVQTNYAYNDLSASILTLQNEIGTLKSNISRQEETIRRLRMQKNSLFSIAKKDDTSDYLNDYKQEIAQNTVLTPVKQSVDESWWDGAYTRNYYGINDSGAIEIYGYGDAEASTKAYKPGPGTNLYLNASGDGTGTNRIITLNRPANEYFGDYSYAAWGTWSDPNADQSPDKNKIYTSHWVVVDQVDRDHMPIVGTATYKGELKGILRNIGIANTIHNANGQISLNANFGTESIAGTLMVNNADTGANWANASFNTRMDTSTDGDGLFFDAALTGSDISNKEEWHSQISGEFGGDWAAEAGGMWAITKGTGSRGDGRAVGVFRAKKQSQVLSGQSWAGATTFHAEDKSTGYLTYWGGNGFDNTIASASQGYGPIFNEDETGREGLVDGGVIKSVHINHGENTSTDNTKDFHIKHDEIDTLSSFYNTNINSLKLKRNLPDGNALSIQTDGHYDYSAWGSWKQTGGLYTNINGDSGKEQMSMHNNWISGQRTVDLPKTGSAKYSGFLDGHLYKGSVGGGYGGKVNGSINLSVDFANTSIVSGTLKINKAGGGSLATATMSNAVLDRSGSSFAARLSGTNIAPRPDHGSQNMISGQFFGPHAEEVGGAWNVEIKNSNGADDHADGIFAAKKQAAEKPAI